MTVSPGSELYSIFGHSAIRVQDTVLGEDKIYNYGTFDFDQPDFYAQFVKGKLNYFLSAGCYPCFWHHTAKEKRTLIETPLELTENEAREILAWLEWNALPGNREYEYDFQYDNCSSRILDILIKQTNGALILDQSAAEESTFRWMLDPYLDKRPWIHAGVDLLLGSRADRKVELRQSSFLPDKLHQLVSQASIERNGEVYRLAGEDQILLSDTPEQKGNSLRPWMLFLTLCLMIVVSVFTGGIYHKIILIAGKVMAALLFLLSVFLILLWLVPEHEVFAWNSDLLWINPLLIVAVFIRRDSPKNLFRYLLLAALVLSSCGIASTWIIERNADLSAAALTVSLFLLSLIIPNKFIGKLQRRKRLAPAEQTPDVQ
ncbi:MAG: DUF4105 domain-containing protein [Bacteroidales bacterium]|nr:DUF4105 domain-containing protein [Bacteroidales bacterium]